MLDLAELLVEVVEQRAADAAAREVPFEIAARRRQLPGAEHGAASLEVVRHRRHAREVTASEGLRQRGYPLAGAFEKAGDDVRDEFFARFVPQVVEGCR